MSSQYGQDNFVVNYFKNKKDGYFVDVGAFNDGDDTVLLEKLGWSGICIEPITGAYQELTERRSCTCLNVCVGNENKQVDFSENVSNDSDSGWYTYTSALSGVVESYSQEHLNRISQENKDWNGKSVIVKKQMMTLTSIFEENNSPSHIDYLKVDIEGGELSCLQGIDFTKNTFDLISLEANYEHETRPCVDLLARYGYAPFVKLGVDIFFRKLM
jgi:FkbM family methyltransferase